MATIVNNSVTADESVLRIDHPYIHIIDPVTGESVCGAQLFFGLVGRDPELEENQKRVYAIQENGAFIPLGQPVITSSGGIPQANGSPAVLAINGAYSYKVLDSKGAQLYYQPRVEHPTLDGLSGVVIEESRTVDDTGQLPEPFEVIETTTASFYASTSTDGVTFNGELMRLGVDYTAETSDTITLITTYPEGTVILGRQNDPTGQILPVATSGTPIVSYSLIADAVAADLQLDQVLVINGGLVVNDGLGGAFYLVVAGGTGAADGENFIDIDNGNQLQLIQNNRRFQRYSEVVVNTVSNTGSVVLNLNSGNTFTLLLTENIDDIAITNPNPLTTTSHTVVLQVTQDGSGGEFGINWGNFAVPIKWAGGAAPTVTADDNAIDVFVFTTLDGGATWFGAVTGQGFA